MRFMRRMANKPGGITTGYWYRRFAITPITRGRPTSWYQIRAITRFNKTMGHKLLP